MTYDQLLRLKASAIKSMLIERSIDCSDCYDKESLAMRMLQHLD